MSPYVGHGPTTQPTMLDHDKQQHELRHNSKCSQKVESVQTSILAGGIKSSAEERHGAWNVAKHSNQALLPHSKISWKL